MYSESNKNPFDPSGGPKRILNIFLPVFGQMAEQSKEKINKFLQNTFDVMILLAIAVVTGILIFSHVKVKSGSVSENSALYNFS